MSNARSGHSGLLVISAADVRRALPMSDCIAGVESAMRAVSRGTARIPLRTIFALPQTQHMFGVMPGYVSSPEGLGAKVLSVFPENRERGLASHVGVVILFDSETGVPLAVMDAGQVTAIRTAAASAVATRVLARGDATELAILGTGEQAATHLEAMAKVRPLRRVRVWGRSAHKAQSFAEQAKGQVAAPIEVCITPADAVAGAHIVCTVTASRDPVLYGADLEPGTHVNLVGSSQVTAREADDVVVTRSRFYVDSRVSARAEAGELRHAIEAGVVDESHVRGEIGEVLDGAVEGRRSPDEITVYKSLGIAAQDLAAARLIYQRATRDGLGTRVPF